MNHDAHMDSMLNAYLADCAAAAEAESLAALVALSDLVEAQDAERTRASDIPGDPCLSDLPAVECVGSAMLEGIAERCGAVRLMEETARVFAHLVGERCAVAYGTTWLVIYREAAGRHAGEVLAVSGDDIAWMARSAEARATLRFNRRVIGRNA